MKKILTLIFVVIAIIACDLPQTSDGIGRNSYGDYNIVVIDSCEYIEYNSGFGNNHVYSLTHKGNCKFCKLRPNK